MNITPFNVRSGRDKCPVCGKSRGKFSDHSKCVAALVAEDKARYPKFVNSLGRLVSLSKDDLTASKGRNAQKAYLSDKVFALYKKFGVV